MFFLALITSLIIASFFEYVSHWAMHHTFFFYKTHRNHHIRNAEETFWKDFFFFYLPLTSPFLFVGFIFGLWIGLGWLCGMMVHIAAFTYSHTRQHEKQPKKVFWLKEPIHHWHHHHGKGFYNYGVTTSFWDKVFGTYRKEK